MSIFRLSVPILRGVCLVAFDQSAFLAYAYSVYGGVNPGVMSTVFSSSCFMVAFLFYCLYG